MERSSRILLLLGPQRQNGWQVALSLGHRMSKTLPVELYSDGVPFRPADSRFYSHRCSHWACPPLRPVALIDAQGSQGVRQLAQWAAPLKEHGYELYLLVYPFSPPADTPRQTVRLIRQAQQRTGLQAKGLIHCPYPATPCANPWFLSKPAAVSCKHRWCSTPPRLLCSTSFPKRTG